MAHEYPSKELALEILRTHDDLFYVTDEIICCNRNLYSLPFQLLGAASYLINQFGYRFRFVLEDNWHGTED